MVLCFFKLLHLFRNAIFPQCTTRHNEEQQMLWVLIITTKFKKQCRGYQVDDIHIVVVFIHSIVVFAISRTMFSISFKLIREWKCWTNDFNKNPKKNNRWIKAFGFKLTSCTTLSFQEILNIVLLVAKITILWLKTTILMDIVDFIPS